MCTQRNEFCSRSSRRAIVCHIVHSDLCVSEINFWYRLSMWLISGQGKHGQSPQSVLTRIALERGQEGFGGFCAYPALILPRLPFNHCIHALFLISRHFLSPEKSLQESCGLFACPFLPLPVRPSLKIVSYFRV